MWSAGAGERSGADNPTGPLTLAEVVAWYCAERRFVERNTTKRRWTRRDRFTLVTMLANGSTHREIAAVLERTELAVRLRASRMDVRACVPVTNAEMRTRYGTTGRRLKRAAQHLNIRKSPLRGLSRREAVLVGTMASVKQSDGRPKAIRKKRSAKR